MGGAYTAITAPKGTYLTADMYTYIAGATGLPLGLIAGNGRFPFLVAAAARRAGRRVVAVAPGTVAAWPGSETARAVGGDPLLLHAVGQVLQRHPQARQLARARKIP